MTKRERHTRRKTSTYHPINPNLMSKTEFDMTTKEGRLEWVMHGWPSWAGFAYEQYMTNGRGVVIFEDESKELKYAHGVEVKGEDSKWANEINLQISTYDPEDEILCAFIFFDLKAFGSYGVDDFPPPKAYIWLQEERKKGGINTTND